MSEVKKLPAPIVIAKSQPFDMAFRFWADPQRTEPLSIASAEAELRRTGGKASDPAEPILFLAEDGQLEIGDGFTVLRLSEAQLQHVDPGEYELVHGVIYGNGGALQLRGLTRVLL